MDRLERFLIGNNIDHKKNVHLGIVLTGNTVVIQSELDKIIEIAKEENLSYAFSTSGLAFNK